MASAAAEYDEDRHGETRAAVARQLADEFDRFAIGGPRDHVHSRLGEMAAYGIERLIIVPGSLDTKPDTTLRSTGRLATEVLPQLAD